MGMFGQSSFWKKMTSTSSKEAHRLYCYIGKKQEDAAGAMDELDGVINKYPLSSGKKRTLNISGNGIPDLSNSSFLVKEGKNFRLFSQPEYEKYIKDSSQRFNGINSVLKNKNPRLASIDKLAPNPVLVPEQLDELQKSDLKLSATNPFRAKLINGQIKWESNDEVGAEDVAEIIEKTSALGRSIHINTGTHGSASGDTVLQNKKYAEADFSKEDLELAWDKDNVSVHIMSQGSPEKTHEHYPKIDIIDAWCFSELKKHAYAGDNSIASKLQNLFKLLARMREAAETSAASERVSAKSESGSAVAVGRDVSGSHNSIGNTHNNAVHVAATQGYEASGGVASLGVKREASDGAGNFSQASKKQRAANLTEVEAAAIIYACISDGLRTSSSIAGCVRSYAAAGASRSKDDAAEIAKQLTTRERGELRSRFKQRDYVDGLIERHRRKDQHEYRAH